MEWSAEQERALDDVAQWHRKGASPLYRLFGYAGTGKTTLAKHFAAGVEGRVFFVAFTGKAAYVMQQRGCEDATTIHSLIYTPKDKSKKRLRELEDKLLEVRSKYLQQGMPDVDIEAQDDIIAIRVKIHDEHENLKRPSFALDLNSRIREAALVVIDECSMVDQRMAEDLLSFGVPLLVLGDPAQLPPVGANEGYFTNAKPDFMLTEIHRQARDSPIIRLATMARQHQDLPLGEYDTSRVIDWADVEPSDAQEADQVIVGTNDLKRGTNRRMRELAGITSVMPVIDDKVVCLRNDREAGLLNGGLWKVNRSEVVEDGRLFLDVRSEDGNQDIACEAHAAHFLGEKLPWYMKKEAQEFDYGYALTCHKSQGSQWPILLVFDQSRVFRQHQYRWIYTAITRASDRLTVVKP